MRLSNLCRLCAASLLLTLAACSKTTPSASSTPAGSTAAPSASAAAKVYTVATDAAYAPFESLNEKGEIVGFDIDVLNAAAQRGGVQVKFVNTPWDGIFATLQQGDRDLIASAVTITDERKQSVDFSDPYFDAQQLIATKASAKIGKFGDLKKLKVGVQTGTTGDDVVSGLLGNTNTNLKRFESTPQALQELEAGGVDAVVADNGVLINYLAHHVGTQLKTVTDKAFAPEQYGIAVKKGSSDLLGRLNKGLSDIKADGTYGQIYAKYFSPATTTSASASAGAK